jgi:hypothetical protein
VAGDVRISDEVVWVVASVAWETLFVEVWPRLPPDSVPAQLIDDMLHKSKTFYLDIGKMSKAEVVLVRDAVVAARAHFEREELAGPYDAERFLKVVDDLISKLRSVS